MVESLEGRQLLSATHVAGPVMAATSADAAAIVGPMTRHARHVRHVASVKRAAAAVPRTNTIVSLDPFIGDFYGALYHPDESKTLCLISVQSSDGHGNYFGTLGLKKLAVDSLKTVNVQFTINAAGDFNMLYVSGKQVIKLKGASSDGTMQGTYECWDKHGKVTADVFTSVTAGF